MSNRRSHLSRHLAALVLGTATLLCGAVQAQAPAASGAAAPPAATAATTAPGPAAVATLPAAAATAAPATRPAGEAVDNPYGLEALWRGSDVVARVVLLLLALMSAGSWYVMVVKALEQTRIGRQAATMGQRFWAAASVREGAGLLEKNSPYRYVAESGAEAVNAHTGLKRHIPLAEWIPMSVQGAVDQVQAKTQGGLAFLATVGSTSPFVGLFGTVWGIYHALTAIGLSGQASIDKVAGPVGEALIMTAIGLAVAIPAVFGYNWLAKKNKAVMDGVRDFSDELNAVLVASAGKAA